MTLYASYTDKQRIWLDTSHMTQARVFLVKLAQSAVTAAAAASTRDWKIPVDYNSSSSSSSDGSVDGSGSWVGGGGDGGGSFRPPSISLALMDSFNLFHDWPHPPPKKGRPEATPNHTHTHTHTHLHTQTCWSFFFLYFLFFEFANSLNNDNSNINNSITPSQKKKTKHDRFQYHSINGERRNTKPSTKKD